VCSLHDIEWFFLGGGNDFSLDLNFSKVTEKMFNWVFLNFFMYLCMCSIVCKHPSKIINLC
jgi:hypothetical protein